MHEDTSLILNLSEKIMHESTSLNMKLSENKCMHAMNEMEFSITV